MPSNHVLPLTGGPPPAYEARRKRTEWPESVRADEEVKALDETNGEWILCRTCADHYERTRRGRKPNDPEGFKVRMNGRFQEAAWLMHKSRVVAHRAVLGGFAGHAAAEEEEEFGGGLDAAMVRGSKRQKTSTSGSDSDEPTACEAGGAGGASGAGFFSEDHPRAKDMGGHSPEAMHIPRTGWRCPGIVPDYFYQAHADLVHAFSKYYVGNYRVNVVRDIRSDKVMLFAHDCENRVVQRDRPTQPISCNKCYGIWLHNKSFKRILKKMDRYNQVEAILRHSWSLSAEDLSVLSKFKHASGMNLSSEGRQLKQAAMTVLKQFNDKSMSMVSHAPARVMQLPPSAAELMLSDSSSFDSGMHDSVGSDDAGPTFEHDDDVVVVVGGPRGHHHVFQSLSSGQPRYERQV